MENIKQCNCVVDNQKIENEKRLRVAVLKRDLIFKGIKALLSEMADNGYSKIDYDTIQECFAIEQDINNEVTYCQKVVDGDFKERQRAVNILYNSNSN